MSRARLLADAKAVGLERSTEGDHEGPIARRQARLEKKKKREETDKADGVVLRALRDLGLQAGQGEVGSGQVSRGNKFRNRGENVGLTEPPLADAPVKGSLPCSRSRSSAASCHSRLREAGVSLPPLRTK